MAQSDVHVSPLSNEVIARISDELGERATKVVACLRTAAVLIVQAHEDASDLRLAESAAYNLREALDAVTADRPPPSGGVAAVATAWRDYRRAADAPDADLQAARNDLDAVLELVAEDQQRQAQRTLKLLEYLRDQAGIEPLTGDQDPVRSYARLLADANSTLHDTGTITGVAALYDDTLAWFTRLFTPPDARVAAIVQLAQRPYSTSAARELQGLALNGHHLGLFFARLADPEWLGPLHDAGLVGLPQASEPWPITNLIGGQGGIEASRIAAVLDRVLTQSRAQPEPARIGVAREVIQSASRLGADGHGVATKILARYRGDHWVQVMALSIAKAALPEDPIQLAVADAIVGNEGRNDAGYLSRRSLGRLLDGLTEGNVTDRLRMMAGKLRRMAGDPGMRFTTLDAAPLDADGDDDLREPVLILAQHFARVVPRARDLGIGTAQLVSMIERVPGELGERLVSRVLAGADDVGREAKVRHVEKRLHSSTATGDDRYLIEDILTSPLSAEDAETWRQALGDPGQARDGDIGDNWPKAWRWSMLLPAAALDGWQDAIAAVTARYGQPSPDALSSRIPRFTMSSGSSPISASELAEMSTTEAARSISTWRPGADTGWGVSARELARALEAAVKEDPRKWTADPVGFVTGLREPVYIDHYLRGVAAGAGDSLDRTPALFAAVRVVRANRWAPAVLGSDSYDYESDWSGVDTAVVELVTALARKDAPFGNDLDLAWSLSAELMHDLPDELPELATDQHAGEHDDPLNRAINRSYGRGMEAVLALAGWEHRQRGDASARLTDALDEALAVPGVVGAELRAVIACRRPFVETIARDWLTTNAADLFADPILGKITLDQTLKYSSPTKWFYDRFHVELLDAARRGADHATSWLLIAYLWSEPRYTFRAIVGPLAGNVHALESLGHELAHLVRTVDRDDPVIERGVDFWKELLAADRGVVPAKSLVGLGRWTLVEHLDDERWLSLTEETLRLTGGEIEMAIEIAERCKDAQRSSPGLRILRLMLGHGEPWERHHIDAAAVDALRAPDADPTDTEFGRLRTRLLERGRHEVADI